MKEYKHLFFDLDGTLTDSEEGIVKSMQFALNKAGADFADADFKRYLGPPLAFTFGEFFDGNQEKVLETIGYYRERYEQVGLLAENKLYDGIVDMLSALCGAGYSLSIVTSKPERYAEKVLSHFQINKYFDGIFGATMSSERTHKIEVLEYALQNRKAVVSEVVMIGDRLYDLEAAQTAGVDSIGVLYGYGSEEELSAYPALFLAKTPNDISKFFVR